MDEQNAPNKKDVEKYQAAQNAETIAKEAGKKVLQAKGVPAPLAGAAVDKAAENPFVKKAINQVANKNPIVRKALSSAPPIGGVQDNASTENSNVTSNEENDPIKSIMNKTDQAKEFGQSGIEQLASGIQKIYTNPVLRFLFTPPMVFVVGGFLAIILILFLIILSAGSDGSSEGGGSGLTRGGIGYYNSGCSTDDPNHNLVTFLTKFEGSGAFCDSNNYKAEHLNEDGTITAGKGVTNYALSSSTQFINDNNFGKYFNLVDNKYTMNEGDCVPVDVIDKIELYSIENRYSAPIDSAAQQLGIKLTQFQKDAITSFNYNIGEAHTYKLLEAYANDGLEGLWNFIKAYKYSQGRELEGLKKRRKAEFALFVTGDYSDQGLFYGRKLDNYDNFDSEGVLAREYNCAQTDYALPVRTGVCTSPFGYRIHPITYKLTFHRGLDIGAARNTPIYSTKSGTVTRVVNNIQREAGGDAGGAGNNIIIKHDDNSVARYLHLHYNSVTVKVGDKVVQGQHIGGIGNTGSSTGPHLHFQIEDSSGTPMDPYDYMDWTGFGNKCKKQLELKI